MQRHGYLHRDCLRLVNNDRNHFASCMVALGDADAMVTGTTRNYSTELDDIRRCVDVKPGHRVIGVSLVLCRDRTVLVADTAVIDMPNSQELADIAEEAAGVARRMGYEPRVAMLAYSTFGIRPASAPKRSARRSAFSIGGASTSSMTAKWPPMWRSTWTSWRNIRSAACRAPPMCLVMPAFHSASISTKMLQELGDSTVIGPLLVGLDKSIQITSMAAKDSDIVNMAAIAAYNVGS